MKYLGIDYGDKRVGLSVSDEGGRLAFPYSVLKNSKTLIAQILQIINKEKIEKIVVGESLYLHGEPNVIQKDISEFCINLESQSGLSTVLEPEFFTSAQVERDIGKNEMHDASAAALILQSYLDREKNML